MASYTISRNQPDKPSVVNCGGKPVTRRIMLELGEGTEARLIAWVNARRASVRSRVPAGTPVVPPAESIEDALLDIIATLVTTSPRS